MSAPFIAVLDYGIGNLRSAEKALLHLGARARLVQDPDEAAAADGVVLPGVGAFGACVEALAASGLDRAALAAVARGTPFLGVCVGYQLMYDASVESPGAAGLGLYPGTIERLPEGVKHPQMQWNRLSELDGRRSQLLSGLDPGPWVYFVHSYAPAVGPETVAVCDYGGPVAAVAEQGHVWGTQFHPEKSGTTGLAILGNFIARLRAVILLPAIDLRGGGAVRLVQGDFAREQAYGDPVDLARRFVAAGAKWLHVVDLDAARTGHGANRGTVSAIAAVAGVPVQCGGGVRTEDDVAELAAGVARVVLGTAALEDAAFAERCARRWPGQVALGLDYRRRPDGVLEPARRGWLEGSGLSVTGVLDRLAAAPLGAVVVTAIEHDGTLSGPDTEGLCEVLAATAHPVVASGGVGSAADLRALVGLDGARPLAGVVVGRALVDGSMSVEEALAACAASG